MNRIVDALVEAQRFDVADRRALRPVFLVPATTFDVDEQVRFALDLGAATITGVGTIVRGTADGARGLRFDDLDDHGELALSAFVARRQHDLAEQYGLAG